MMKTDTIDYYDTNAVYYSEHSKNLDLTEIQNEFLSFLKEGDRILDLGCGSGRDTKRLLDLGFDVDAVDGSIELAKIATEYTGIEVKCMDYKELDSSLKYEGIWACSALLHLPEAELEYVLRILYKALKQSGVIYASFKYGLFEGMRDGRYYIDMNEEKVALLCEKVDGLVIEEEWISADSEQRENKWINVIIRKKEV